MKIIYKNNFTFLKPENKFDFKRIEEIKQKLIINEFRYIPSLRKRKNIKKCILFKSKNGLYFTYSGLFPIIKNPNSYFYPIVHKSFISIEKLKEDNIWSILRGYQKEAVIKLLKYPRGILQSPTGSGKTEIIIAICKAIKDHVPILVIIPKSQSLLEQTISRFLKYFDRKDIGYNYGKGYKEGRIMISSPGCLQKLSLNHYKVLLVDEVQVTPSKTTREGILACKNAIIRYGFSGTPTGRSDKQDLITLGLLGLVTVKIPYQKLWDKGFIAPVRYFIIKYDSENLLDPDIWCVSNTNNWNDIIEEYFVNNKTRLEIITELTKKTVSNNRNLLIIVERIEHGKILKQKLEIELDQEKIEFIYSKSKSNNLKIKNFKEGRYKILIATQLIETGIDIPNIDTIIIASIGKSNIQLLQRIGRGLRPKENKELLVFDLVDTNSRILEKHAIKRKNIVHTNQINTIEIEIYKNINKELENKLWKIFKN